MSQSQPKYHFCRFLILVVSGVLLTSSLCAQELEIRRQTTGIAGASISFHHGGKQLIVQQSIGQASVIGTHQARNYSLRQGFIQPEFTVRAAIENTDLQATVFPNPFRNQFQIRFDDDIEDQLDIQIFDLTGRAILGKQFSAAQLITIHFPDAAVGMYVIRITTGKKQFTGRIQKLNL